MLCLAHVGLGELGAYGGELFAMPLVLLGAVVDEHVEKGAGLGFHIVAVILDPAHGSVGAHDAVLYVVHVELVGRDLAGDGVLNPDNVVGVDHAGEGEAGEPFEGGQVIAAEDTAAGLVSVDKAFVGIGPVDEKAAGHVGEHALDAQRGEGGGAIVRLWGHGKFLYDETGVGPILLRPLLHGG